MIKELKDFVKFAEHGINAIEIPLDIFLSQIRSLERELKHKLIIRIDDSNFVLTEFGRGFIPFANKVVKTVHESTNIITKQSTYDLFNQLTIVLARDSATTWALNCLRNFNKMHPGLRVILLVWNKATDYIIENANVIFWAFDEIPEEFDAYWYVEFKYGLYASDKYIEIYGKPTLDTINQHPIIAYSGSDHIAKFSNWHLYGEYGLPLLHPTIFSQSRDVITKMVSEGIGIGAISDRQDVYYGYGNLEHVVKTVEGPVLRCHFVARKGMNEQERCNVSLISRLFREYFKKNDIMVKDFLV